MNKICRIFLFTAVLLLLIGGVPVFAQEAEIPAEAPAESQAAEALASRDAVIAEPAPAGTEAGVSSAETATADNIPSDAPAEADALPAQAPAAPALPVSDIYYKEPPGEEEVEAPAAQDERKRTSFLEALKNYFTDPAPSRRYEPLRHFDWEIAAGGAGVANDLLSASEILRKTIEINGNDLFARSGEAGVRLNADVFAKTAMNFNGASGGGGIFAGVDGRVDFLLSRDMLALFAEGNAAQNTRKGDFVISGAFFAEAGFHSYGTFGKFRLDVRPSWFLPLAYIPQTRAGFAISTKNNISIQQEGEVIAYLPFNPEDRSITNYGGVDLSASLIYAIFPILDAGLEVSHIPIIPARLSNKASVTLQGNILDELSIIDIINNPGNININFSPDYSIESAEKYIMRPFSMDLYAFYRPFRIDLFSLRPSIGFTTGTPSSNSYFNMNLSASLNLGRILFIGAESGIRDGIWRHGLSLGINFRLIEIDIALRAASQDYAASWQGKGLSLQVGLHAGW